MKTKATPTMSSLNELRNVRTQPIQQRSSDRMKSLLDAAAILIDEEGIDGVTTTAVAYRSRSSVGVLYRYFPNVDSLLKALAQRNMSRYLDRVHEGAQKTSDEPWSAWDNTLDSYVDMCRHEPGFRSLGFGDIINERFLDEELSNNSVIARAFAEQLAETHNVPVTDTMMFHLDAGIAMGAALIHRAFLYEPRGDKKFIEECRTVIGTYLRSQLPLTS
jgi:AcrR family transcriptional regulator